MGKNWLKSTFVGVHNFVVERLPGKTTPSKEWINPDGTIGGTVALDANVEEGSIIPRSAIVTSGATVKAGDILHEGDFVTQYGIIRLDSNPEFRPVR